MTLDRIFSWQETRRVSKSLTLNDKRVLYVLDPTAAARTAGGQRVGIEEREDGSLTFWHGEHALLATAFPREHGVQQGHVVESKRLSETLEIIKTRQRARARDDRPADDDLTKGPPAAGWRAATDRDRGVRRGRPVTEDTGPRGNHGDLRGAETRGVEAAVLMDIAPRCPQDLDNRQTGFPQAPTPITLENLSDRR